MTTGMTPQAASLGPGPDVDTPASGASPPCCEILVIGGGPAGATAAGMLAARGYRVVLLEKAHHPRFHIGESLLPANLPLLEIFGVAAEVRAIGMQKWGAEFISAEDGRRQEFEFSFAWDKSLPFAFHVRRSEFDEILIRRAAALGAEVREGCCVRRVDLADGRGVRVFAVDEDGTPHCWRADCVVDASGRDTLLGTQLRAKRRNRRHSSAAIYAHFAGAFRDTGKRAGHISIFWFDHGWFWYIPLADGATSVGAVVWPQYMKARSGTLADFFLASIASCPPLAERLAGASLLTEVEATGNYSYCCDHTHAANYFLIGDAYAFIDPVFSSGVMMAMQSGMAAAETIDACRKNPATRSRALKRFDRLMRHGPRQFSWFIYRVTTPAMRELFLGPGNLLRMQEALLSLLAGDIYGTTPIWPSLRAFKFLYYAVCILHLPSTMRAARRRRRDIRPLESASTAGG